MSAVNDGGPAFPTLVVLGDKAVAEGGLTLRDYFVAHADIPWDVAQQHAHHILLEGARMPTTGEILLARAHLKDMEADAMLTIRDAYREAEQ